MYRTEDRRKAVELRLKGLSYSEIKGEIRVSNGVLSYWLKGYPLTERQKMRLKVKKAIQIEKFRETMKQKRELRLTNTYHVIQKQIGKVTNRDLLIAGAFLYWGEGQKVTGSVSVSNTDPNILKFCLLWLERCFGVHRRNPRLRIYLHLYSDMKLDEEIDFWQKILVVDRTQFNKPYIKLSTKSSLDYKSFGHGTCRIQLSDVKIKEEIMATIRFFSEYSSKFDSKGPVVQR